MSLDRRQAGHVSRAPAARCHLGLDQLYRTTNQLTEAREHLATAVTTPREMGMAFWLNRAEAELRG